MKEKKCLLHGFLLSALLFMISCNDNQTEKKSPEGSKKDSTKSNGPVAETKRGPVINIGDTLSIKTLVLTMKDSAATIGRVSLKLGEIYGAKLGAVLKKNNLKMTGAPMAWYKGE